MGIGITNNLDKNQIFQYYRSQHPVSQKTQQTDEAKDTSIFVSEGVDSRFAENVINQYSSLAKDNDKRVSNVIILASPDFDQIDEIEELDDKSKALIKEYIQSGEDVPYGFYSKKNDSIVLIESSHNRKDTRYEGSVEEQGADTMLHEYGHLCDTGISSSDKYKQAYLADLKAIEKQLKENPDATIGDSDMTYRDAMVYFDHYYEGADFSDGIDESDVTRRGLRENWAESYATVYDNCQSDVNAIYATLFKNTTDFVREYVA